MENVKPFVVLEFARRFAESVAVAQGPTASLQVPQSILCECLLVDWEFPGGGGRFDPKKWWLVPG